MPTGEDWCRHHGGQQRGKVTLHLLLWILGVGLILLILITLGDRQAFDLRVARFLGDIENPALYRVMVVVSWFGWQPQVVLISVPLVVLLFARGLLPESAGLLRALLIGTPVYLLLALLGDRLRPYIMITAMPTYREIGGVSFPSGHVINYVLFCGFLAYLTYTLVRHPAARRALLAPTLALLALVGPSRAYLGQH